MKRILRIGLLSVLLCVALVGSVHAMDDSNLSLVTVTGEAEVKVVPDEVVILLGVETSDPSLAKAKAENDRRTREIMRIAKELGIEKKHIQTDQISIQPRYRDQWENREFIGYFVTQRLSITLRETEKYEELVSGILEAGANYLYNVEFRTTESRKHRDEARVLAVRAAKEKAELLAEELGQRVGRPHHIQEESVGRGGPILYANTARGLSAEETDSLALGQITITARVTISFELQ